jgi:hypothetical protein
MRRPKFGEVLSRHVSLSSHDIDEILHEQSHTGGSRKRFGDVAMSLGLCTAQDIWKAWCEQIKDSIEHVDLDQLGIDAQAVGALPVELAVRCTALPVRQTETHLVIATSHEGFDEAAVQLPPLLHRKLRFVIAPREQVRQAIETYYHVVLG